MISKPWASSSPMLSSCRCVKPPVTGNCRETMASLTVRSQYVKSRLARSSKKPSSAPTSISRETSGLSASLPRLAGCTPGPSAEFSGEKVVNLAKAFGWRPDSPTAARSRTVDRRSLLHPRPWVGMMEMLALG